MNELKISDYFKKTSKKVSNEDWSKIKNIRNTLNSFDDIDKQEKWIYDRRLSNFNKNEDLRLFGIPFSAEIKLHNKHKENEYYQNDNDVDQDDNLDEIDDGDGAESKDSHKQNKNFLKNKLKPSLNNKGANFVKNIKNSKFFKTIKFIIENIYVIGIGFLIIFGIILALIITFYITGVINSVGHTPFLLCGNEEINGTSSIKALDAASSEAATTEYAINIFIKNAKERNWKDNAIKGVISYILQEGGGMGTFTYEGYYMYNGPSGKTNDTTLDNQKWINWLTGNGKEQAHKGYYKDSEDYYAAIGLGLLQSSDVWSKDGKTYEAQNATDLINYANENNLPWQDPETQIKYIFDKIFTLDYAFDTNDVDPTKDELSPEEWCARITAGIGIMGLDWYEINDKNEKIISSNSIIQDHIEHIPEAIYMFEHYNSEKLNLSFRQTSKTNLCGTANTIISGGNGSIASAAVTLAATARPDNYIEFTEWGENSPDFETAKGKLDTYKRIHIKLLPGDDLFASCDRAACCAIRWSGADTEFPVGATSTQYNYLCKTTDKWQFIGKLSSDKDKLVPGDVLITEGAGHIQIYVGNEEVRKRFPESNADTYCASYCEFYPMLFNLESSRNSDDQEYAIFRNTTVTDEGNKNESK